MLISDDTLGLKLDDLAIIAVQCASMVIAAHRAGVSLETPDDMFPELIQELEPRVDDVRRMLIHHAMRVMQSCENSQDAERLLSLSRTVFQQSILETVQATPRVFVYPPA